MSWGGVVFLDEIGDLPPEIQAKFLVYLDNFEFEPDGWRYGWKIHSPAFVIAATNKDLKTEVERGNFRRDLYHRFTHKLTVPPLRERRNDIRALIDFVLQSPEINRNNSIKEISLSALTRLEEYSFPGNFRELEGILSKAIFRARQDGRSILLEEDLEF
jgi:transcriptional regulator with GAF, ATPase, and Fis domain